MRPSTNSSAPSSSTEPGPISLLDALDRPPWASSFRHQVNVGLRNMEASKPFTDSGPSDHPHVSANANEQGNQPRQGSSKWRHPERRTFIAICLAIVLTTAVLVGTLVAVGKASRSAQRAKEPYPISSSSSIHDLNTTSYESAGHSTSSSPVETMRTLKPEKPIESSRSLETTIISASLSTPHATDAEPITSLHSTTNAASLSATTLGSGAVVSTSSTTSTLSTPTPGGETSKSNTAYFTPTDLRSSSQLMPSNTAPFMTTVASEASPPIQDSDTRVTDIAPSPGIEMQPPQESPRILLPTSIAPFHEPGTPPWQRPQVPKHPRLNNYHGQRHPI